MPTDNLKKTVKKAVKKATSKSNKLIVMIRQSDGKEAEVHPNNVDKFKTAGYR